MIRNRRQIFIGHHQISANQQNLLSGECTENLESYSKASQKWVQEDKEDSSRIC
jgi:hypothetical protein